jgi:hypothetical protein
MLVRGSAERFRICLGRFPQKYLLVFQGVLTPADVKLGGADVGKVLISASLITNARCFMHGSVVIYWWHG